MEPLALAAHLTQPPRHERLLCSASHRCGGWCDSPFDDWKCLGSCSSCKHYQLILSCVVVFRMAKPFGGPRFLRARRDEAAAHSMHWDTPWPALVGNHGNSPAGATNWIANSARCVLIQNVF